MTSAFTNRQKKALSNYVTHVLKQLELSDWRINLSDDPPEHGDAGASITSTYGRQLATLNLPNGFFDDDLTKIEHYLIHEICHLYSEGIDNVINNGPEILMGKPAFTVFFEAYKVAMEYMTDKLAYVVADLLDGAKYDALLRALKPAAAPAEPKNGRR